MTPFTFTPGLTLEPPPTATSIQIKGASPSYSYFSTLVEIYPHVPSLNARDAYRRIRQLFERADDLLSNQLKLKDKLHLPEAATEIDAISLLNVILDPAHAAVSSLELSQVVIDSVENVFHLEHSLPYPLSRASRQKLMHTLCWVDTNIKLNVEWVLIRRQVPPEIVRQIAEAALMIYSLILKMRDYKLALSINFNHSIFLQDRILNLIFGDALYLRREQANRGAGVLSNRMALELLKGLGELSYRELCTMSVFMGVVWTGLPEVQRDYATHPTNVLADLQKSLSTRPHRFCIDHIDHFLTEVGHDEDKTLAVVLDDNGESAFDIALFQRLLQETSRIRLVFIVNRFPVSTNISVQALAELLSDSALAPLRHYFDKGRAQLCVEEQPFRSFEPSYLSAEAKRVIERAAMVYIKGVNFFETLQPQNVLRYYCFTVMGHNCVMLTGCNEGYGVFARVPVGRPGFAYHSAENITTLVDTLQIED